MSKSKNLNDSLKNNIIESYAFLRLGIGILAILFPIILAVGGFAFYNLTLQDSISAYYHAFVPTQQFPDLFAVAGNGVMRNWFIGILWSIGIFLFLYKGYSYRENVALNIAGLLLIAVAMFPMNWTCGSSCPKISIHGVAAILFFLAIGYVCIFRSSDTLDVLKNDKNTDKKKRNYKFWYVIFGLVMWVFPLTVAVFEFFQINLFGTRTVFFIEVVGIWVFSAYWLLKNYEISTNQTDQRIIKDEVVRTPTSRYKLEVPKPISNPIDKRLVRSHDYDEINKQ